MKIILEIKATEEGASLEWEAEGQKQANPNELLIANALWAPLKDMAHAVMGRLAELTATVTGDANSEGYQAQVEAVKKRFNLP